MLPWVAMRQTDELPPPTPAPFVVRTRTSWLRVAAIVGGGALIAWDVLFGPVAHFFGY